MTDIAVVSVPYDDPTAELIRTLLLERTDLVEGDADDLAWDVLHALQDAPNAAIIDWKRKYQEKVTNDIEQREKQRQKLADAQLELDKQKQRNVELVEQVRKLTPAGEQLAEFKQKHDEHCNTTAKLIFELRQRINRGQRGVYDDMIGWLQERSQRLPVPTPDDIRDALIEEVDGDELLTIDMALYAIAARGYQVTPGVSDEQERPVRIGITAETGGRRGLPLSVAGYLTSAVGAGFPGTTMGDTRPGESISFTIPEQDYLNPVDSPDIDPPTKDDPSTLAFLQGFQAAGGVGADVSLPPWLLELILQTTDGMLADAADETNYISMGFRHPETAQHFEWIISRPGRPGPHELRERELRKTDPQDLQSLERFAEAMFPGLQQMGTRARRHRLQEAHEVMVRWNAAVDSP